MARHVDDRSQWAEDADGGDWDDDEVDTVPCPYCRRPIYEDAERCPYCDRYISEEDVPSTRKPWWIVLGVVLCLLIFWMWIQRG